MSTIDTHETMMDTETGKGQPRRLHLPLDLETALKLRDATEALTKTTGFKLALTQAPVLRNVRVTVEPLGTLTVEEDGVEREVPPPMHVTMQASDRYLAWKITTTLVVPVDASAEDAALLAAAEGDYLLDSVGLLALLKKLTRKEEKTLRSAGGRALVVLSSYLNEHGGGVQLDMETYRPARELWEKRGAATEYGSENDPLVKDPALANYPPRLPFPKDDSWKDNFGAPGSMVASNLLLAEAKIIGEEKARYGYMGAPGELNPRPFVRLVEAEDYELLLLLMPVRTGLV